MFGSRVRFVRSDTGPRERGTPTLVRCVKTNVDSFDRAVSDQAMLKNYIFLRCVVFFVTAACVLLPSQVVADLGEAGAFEVDRGRAHFGLNVPASLTKPHGPSGVFIFFGGSDDSVATYQRSIGAIANDLDIIAVVPQLPWFSDSGQADVAEVHRMFQRLQGELAQAYNLDPSWLIVGGASAGGTAAHEYARRNSSRVDLLLLASTGPFADVSRPRTLHVVGEDEGQRLGSGNRARTSLGRGKKDSFIIPGGRHSAQTRHIRVWLETEVSELRLAAAESTLERAAALARAGQRDEAADVLRSTWRSIDLLRSEVNSGDALFDYERERRAEVLKRYQPVIERLESARGHLEG